jgi:hypothetical protein
MVDCCFAGRPNAVRADGVTLAKDDAEVPAAG